MKIEKWCHTKRVWHHFSFLCHFRDAVIECYIIVQERKSNMKQEKTILVVEDNELNREILTAILEDSYSVLQAENGREALEILESHDQDLHLILLDLHMPVMDGYTLMNKMKENPRYASIPVIVITQDGSEREELNALTMGAVDFVPKPYRAQIILHRIASIFRLQDSVAMANQFKYDRMTGIYSKDYFCQITREVLTRNPDERFDILCLDIENFKLFNDTFGLTEGDRLLCVIAQLLRDTIGPYGIYGRFAGGKFVYTQKHKEEYKEHWFECWNNQIKQRLHNQKIEIKWGIYEIVDPSISIEQMCDRALMAANVIKGQYHKNFFIYDEELRNKMLREQIITDAMERGLTEEQFMVYYQPKYDLNHLQIIGAEALVRWIHPEKGFLSPAEFIPIFEKNGFITTMDIYVWEQVCIALRYWKKKGYPMRPVSVNVSRTDLYQPELVDVLLGLTQKYEVSPQNLHLEITESAYTENSTQIIQTIDKLHNLGFVIEMDDFGSGYSSLNMLSAMKLDILKLDMKFVQNETQKQTNRGMLRYIVEMAHRMNLRVVAEGIETRSQMEQLRELGCDFGQGYYFSKPVPKEEYENTLKTLPKEENYHIEKRTVWAEQNPYILLIEEEENNRKILLETLGNEYQILLASDIEDLRTRIIDYGQQIELVIMSMNLESSIIQNMIDQLRISIRPDYVPILGLVTGKADLDVLSKEFDVDDLSYKPEDTYCVRCMKQRINSLLILNQYRKNEKELRLDASFDYLTGLLNRRGLKDSIERLRQEEFPVACYIFDIDNLKKINDRYGHGMGDQVIQSFGEVLNQHTRYTDVCARYGGDEFVAILKNVSSEEDARKRGNEICRTFSNRWVSKLECSGCSGGIVLCQNKEEFSDRLFILADEALYRAKTQGKDNCCL